MNDESACLGCTTSPSAGHTCEYIRVVDILNLRELDGPFLLIGKVQRRQVFETLAKTFCLTCGAVHGDCAGHAKPDTLESLLGLLGLQRIPR